MIEADWLTETDIRRMWDCEFLYWSHHRKWLLFLSAWLPLLTQRSPCVSCREEVRSALEQVAESEWENREEMWRQVGIRAHPPGSTDFCILLRCFYFIRGAYHRAMPNEQFRTWDYIRPFIDQCNEVCLNELSRSFRAQTAWNQEDLDHALNAFRSAVAAEWNAGADLLREVVGIPWRRYYVSDDWLTWHDRVIESMARRMYDTRDFRDMPILADALEEAGCTDADFLNHCRRPGQHVRGCWVIDLLLGKRGWSYQRSKILIE